MNCKHCHSALVSDIAYEDAIYKHLINWLCKYSCITWIRAYPDFSKPDKCPLGQYGIVYISTYSGHKGATTHELKTIRVDENDVLQDKFCLVIDETETITIELDVHGDNGIPNCTQKELNDIDFPVRSASDTLRHIRRMIRYSPANDELSGNAISLKTDNGVISTESEQINNTWQSFVSMQVEANICVKTSVPIDGSMLIWCAESCGGEPLCIKDETCE